MGEDMKKTRERLENEFCQISSNEKWTKESLEMMKDVLKSMYYIDVICAMKDGEEYPGSSYMPPANSYAMSSQRRTSMGQYSRNGSYDNGGRMSGNYPMYGGYSYGYRNGMSGRRSYDDERDHAVHQLHQMMENEQNDEVRMAIQAAINELNR